MVTDVTNLAAITRGWKKPRDTSTLRKKSHNTMNDVRENAMHFEAVKVSMSQNKDGVILRLAVHPNDCPADLHTDWVGSRYVVAMVRLNDQDEPEERQEQKAIERLISSCGLLCRNEDFWSFLMVEDEEGAVQAIRDRCGIKSRTEFRDNVTARNKFEEIREDFKKWKSN